MARLAGNPRVLLWARCTLSTARLANGDVAGALLHATAAARVRDDARLPLGRASPGGASGRGLTAAGNPDRAVAAMLESFGGGSLGALLPADRARCRRRPRRRPTRRRRRGRRRPDAAPRRGNRGADRPLVARGAPRRDPLRASAGTGPRGPRALHRDRRKGRGDRRSAHRGTGTARGGPRARRDRPAARGRRGPRRRRVPTRRLRGDASPRSSGTGAAPARASCPPALVGDRLRAHRARA